MGVIERDEVIGYDLAGDIWCLECWKKDTGAAPELTEENYILEDEEKIYFCDQCKKELSWCCRSCLGE